MFARIGESLHSGVILIGLEEKRVVTFPFQCEGGDHPHTYIDKILPGWPLWLHIGFVGWDWVRQWAHLAIDLDTDRGRELVPLLGGGVERTEPELDLQKGRVRSDGRW